MKAARLGKATRTVGKMFFGLTLLLLAVGAGFGGTALIVYHQLGGSRPVDQRAAERALPERKELSRPAPPMASAMAEDSQPRRVAATAADASSYTYADNNSGQPSLPTKRQKPAVSNVPAALATPKPSDEEQAATSSLNDPESHYIVDSRTGRVIGIDGTAGARREVQEEQHLLEAAPRAVAVQTPPPEVRVASAVVNAGESVYHDTPQANVSLPGSQYIPVRRAMPVTSDADTANPRGFNVAAYLAEDRNRPALRAQPVNVPGVQTARAVHVFRLPDGTQALVTD